MLDCLREDSKENLLGSFVVAAAAAVVDVVVVAAVVVAVVVVGTWLIELSDYSRVMKKKMTDVGYSS